MQNDFKTGFLSALTFLFTFFILHYLTLSFGLSGWLFSPKIAQVLIRTRARPAARLLHFITVILANPKIQGEAIIHAPSASRIHSVTINSIITNGARPHKKEATPRSRLAKKITNYLSQLLGFSSKN